MSTGLENTYHNWSSEELEEGIAAVEAEIFALMENIKAKAEEKRNTQRAKLMEGIEEVKAKLRELGADYTVTQISKRKRRQIGNRENAVWLGEKGEKGELVVKLPIRVLADMTEDSKQDLQ